MKVFECEATIENFDKVTAFVEEELENNEVDMKSSMQITIALEEIYVNIAHYAYSKTDADGNVIPNTGTGPMKLSIDVSSEQVLMTFEDKGIPYNPLEKADPDITLSAEERDIGGLGIYMVKQSMDDVVYEHRDGKNILTLVKKL
ncbi:MAG: ATP-binding protein [Pseudobutyrivibrio ruminis]|uniref:ATP-binding protein n=1 Tax=Pseudobutyrivibrio ruminis TaxID=46206 RepID=UPI0026F1D99F|nr:ATP-binding protein [Pseudobutyrivibrio ruminis]MBE5913411.1 ATP-binding protein [Pseudobutyrivibrio ruminis]